MRAPATELAVSIRLATLPVGTLLVRVPAASSAWPRTLPAVPAGATVTVTLGRATLLPDDGDGLVGSGYRVAGVAADHRPLGDVVDLLVTPALREAEPAWWAEVRGRADRVFDLRFGPVAALLAAEIALHLEAV